MFLFDEAKVKPLDKSTSMLDKASETSFNPKIADVSGLLRDLEFSLEEYTNSTLVSYYSFELFEKRRSDNRYPSYIGEGSSIDIFRNPLIEVLRLKEAGFTTVELYVDVTHYVDVTQKNRRRNKKKRAALLLKINKEGFLYWEEWPRSKKFHIDHQTLRDLNVALTKRKFNQA